MDNSSLADPWYNFGGILCRWCCAIRCLVTPVFETACRLSLIFREVSQEGVVRVVVVVVGGGGGREGGGFADVDSLELW